MDDAAVGKHHGQAEHVLAHRPVANGGRARGARRGHAADRRVGAGIDRKHQAGVLQVRIELEPRQAGLDRNVEILGAEPQHPRHARQIDRDAAVDGVDVAFERAAHAERHDRHAVLGAELDDRRRLLRWTVGKTTASGSPGACHDSPWLWCSRTESDVETRSPSRMRSASMMARFRMIADSAAKSRIDARPHRSLRLAMFTPKTLSFLRSLKRNNGASGFTNDAISTSCTAAGR